MKRARERDRNLYPPRGDEPRDAGPSGLPGILEAYPSASGRSPERLVALAPTEPVAKFAMALCTARGGRYSEALTAIDALLPIGDDSELRERVEIERARLSGLVDLRERFLRTTPRKIDTRIDGERLFARVARVENGRVHFEENRAKIESLALDDLDPISLAEMMGDPKREFDGGALIDYPYLLADPNAAPHLLKRLPDDPAAARLVHDARDDYPARLELGEAATALSSIATLVGEIDDAEEVLSSIAELMGAFGELDLVEVRRGSLRRLATLAKRAIFERDGPSLGLAGELTELGEGRVRLHYDFDDVAQLADLVSAPPQLSALAMDGGAKNAVTVDDGQLRTLGSVVQRLPLDFAAPLEIRARVQIEAGAEDVVASWHVYFCHQSSAFVASNLRGDLTVRDRRRGADRTIGTSHQPSLRRGSTFDLRLVHDGTKVRVFLDGHGRGSADVGSRTQGAIHLQTMATVNIELHELTIEGRPLEDSIRALRDRWVESELQELGLGLSKRPAARAPGEAK